MKQSFILVCVHFLLLTAMPLGAQTNPGLYEVDIDSADQYMQNRQYAKALISFKKSFKKGNTDLYDYYNAGCCAALTNKKDEAFSLLTKSIKQGYMDDKWISQDSDLELLRKDKRWPELMKEFKKAQDAIALKFSKIKTLPSMFLIPFQENGLWGYINKETLKVLVIAEFKELGFMSSCTYLYYKDRCRVKLSADAKVLEIIYPVRDEDVMVSAESYDDKGPKPVSSVGGFKGFTMGEKNQIVTFSDIYDYDCDYCSKVSGPYRINDKFYALVKKAGHFGLIDQDGNTLPRFDFEHKTLYRHEKGYGPSMWFYFNDDAGNSGFMNEAGDVKLYNELIGPLYSEFNRFNLNVQKNEDASGILDIEALQWVIKPQPLMISGVSFTFSGECEPYSYQYSRNRILDPYFLIRKGDNAYYMDRNLKVYKPK